MHGSKLFKHPAFYTTTVQNTLKARMPFPVDSNSAKACFAVWEKLEARRREEFTKRGCDKPPPPVHRYPLDAFDAVIWVVEDRLRDSSSGDDAVAGMRERKLAKFVAADPHFIGKLISEVAKVTDQPSIKQRLAMQFHELNGHVALDRLIAEKGAENVTEQEAVDAVFRPEITPNEVLAAVRKHTRGKSSDFDTLRKDMPKIWKSYVEIDKKWSDAFSAAHNAWNRRKDRKAPPAVQFDLKEFLREKGIRVS